MEEQGPNSLGLSLGPRVWGLLVQIHTRVLGEKAAEESGGRRCLTHAGQEFAGHPLLNILSISRPLQEPCG